jgi:tetratricopeptide (TPR) repeat protein
LSNLGFLLVKAGRTEEAIHYLQVADRMEPNNTLIMNRLGFAYRKEGRFGNAYILFTKSLQVEPSNIHTYLYLAELYRARKMVIQVGDAMGMVFSLIEGRGHPVSVNEFLRREANEGILLDRSTIIALCKEECERRRALFCKGS